jgi:hypothetical protein
MVSVKVRGLVVQPSPTLDTFLSKEVSKIVVMGT